MSVPYDLTELYNEDHKPKSLMGTMTSSILIHSAIAVALFLVAPPALDLVTNNIDIEVIEPQLAMAPAVDTAVKEIAAAPASSIKDAELSEKIKAPVVKAQQVAKVPQMQASDKQGEAAIDATVASSAGTSQTLDDIAVPELDTDGVEVLKVGALADNEFDQDFSKVAENTNAVIAAEKNNLDADFKNTADETDASLAGLENQNEQFAKTMDESIAATRTQNAATLNQIKAGELAAAKAARGEQGQNGAGMRNITQVKQLPGNPLPAYSMEERLRKEQGEIIVQAYVTPEGSLKDLKIIKKTGFPNLDQKTLEALKKWKFQKGQEGLVEIPQVWSLKGEAEEMPAALRR